MLLIGVKRFFCKKKKTKKKNTVPWTYLISDLNGEEIVGSFMKKNCKRLIKKNLELKK